MFDDLEIILPNEIARIGPKISCNSAHERQKQVKKIHQCCQLLNFNSPLPQLSFRSRYKRVCTDDLKQNSKDSLAKVHQTFLKEHCSVFEIPAAWIEVASASCPVIGTLDENEKKLERDPLLSKFWSISNPLIFGKNSHQLRFGESIELKNSKSVSFAGGQVIACSFISANPFWLAVYANPGDLKSLSNVDKSTQNLDVGLLQIFSLNDEISKTSMFCGITVDGCPIWDIKRCAGSGIDRQDIVGPFAVATNRNGVLIYCLQQNELKTWGRKIVKVKPVLKLDATFEMCSAFWIDWCPYKPHDQLLATFRNGSVLFWDLKSAEGRSESLLPRQIWKVADGIPIRNAGWVGENKVYAWSAARKLYFYDLQKSSEELNVQGVDMVTVRFFPPPFSAGAIYSSTWRYSDIIEYLPCLYRLKTAEKHRYLISNQAPVWDLSFVGQSGRLLTCDENGEIFCTVVDWLNLKQSFAAIGKGLLSSRVKHKCEDEGSFEECLEAGCEIEVNFSEDKTMTLKEKQRLKSVPIAGLYRIDAIEANGKLFIASAGKSGFLFTMMEN